MAGHCLAKRRACATLTISAASLLDSTEFTSNAILGFTDRQQINWRYIALGEPTRTRSSRASTARLRVELPNGTLFPRSPM